jgi:diguanylate cyclase (GGDEF)-like protein
MTDQLRGLGGPACPPLSPKRPQATHAAESDEDLRLLGEQLRARADEVLERVVQSSCRGPALAAPVRSGFERICIVATTSVAAWMAGEDPSAGRAAGRESWDLFGGFAARRAAPLNEVTKRCLRWRDGVHEVLGECAERLGTPPATLARARAMTQTTLDVTLVRVCETFENECAHPDQELASHREELAFISTHDLLTGLPNRSMVLELGEQMLSRARRRRARMAALLVNVDNLTGVNETLGHDAGDELLQAIAARLEGVVRDCDALGRLGGDEFVLLADEVSDVAGVGVIADRLAEAIRPPFRLASGGPGELTVSASIGIAIGTRMSAEGFLRDADIAMHMAKREGNGRHVIFEAGMQDLVQTRMELEMDLRSALAREEYFLVYQPTFDLGGMVPTGLEALIRWKRPVRGIVTPNDFIPLLEETGLIVEVGRWVLHEACGQGAAWRRAGHPVGIAVNVSARQLDTDDFIADVRHALRASGLQAGALTLEITETTLMRDAGQAVRRLHEIKELGVRVAIDDFGTGYSSLAQLRRFPVDALKIDRSFISQLADDPQGQALIRTLVQLGKALSIETLAEGIEQQSELALLKRACCDSGQGFLFARPLDVQAAQLFLENWRAEPAAAATPPAAPTAPAAPALRKPALALLRSGSGRASVRSR